jgi:hypothetical protein
MWRYCTIRMANQVGLLAGTVSSKELEKPVEHLLEVLESLGILGFRAPYVAAPTHLSQYIASQGKLPDSGSRNDQLSRREARGDGDLPDRVVAGKCTLPQGKESAEGKLSYGYDTDGKLTQSENAERHPPNGNHAHRFAHPARFGIPARDDMDERQTEKRHLALVLPTGLNDGPKLSGRCGMKFPQRGFDFFFGAPLLEQSFAKYGFDMLPVDLSAQGFLPLLYYHSRITEEM